MKIYDFFILMGKLEPALDGCERHDNPISTPRLEFVAGIDEASRSKLVTLHQLLRNLHRPEGVLSLGARRF